MLSWLEEQSSTNQLTWLAPRLFLTSILDISPPRLLKLNSFRTFWHFMGRPMGATPLSLIIQPMHNHSGFLFLVYDLHSFSF